MRTWFSGNMMTPQEQSKVCARFGLIKKWIKHEIRHYQPVTNNFVLIITK